MARFETKRRGEKREGEKREKEMTGGRREEKGGKRVREGGKKRWSGPGKRFPRDLHDGKIVAITALKTDPPPLKNIRIRRYRLSNWEFKCGTATKDDYHLGLFSDENRFPPPPSKREFISLNLLQTFIYRGSIR